MKSGRYILGKSTKEVHTCKHIMYILFLIKCSFSLRHCDQLVLEKCDTLLEMLPQPIATSILSKSVAENCSPYWVVLSQEASGWNRRLQTIVKSLKDTVQAVKGETEMSEEHKDVYNALASEQVPKCWQVGTLMIHVNTVLV